MYPDLIMSISSLLLIGGIGTPELLVIVFVILLLFGGKKIPELMRGLGKGVNNFKKGLNEVEEEINKEPGTKQQTTVKDNTPE